MIIIAYIAIGICCFIAFMLVVTSIIQWNSYDSRIRLLECWKKEAQGTIGIYQKLIAEQASKKK